MTVWQRRASTVFDRFNYTIIDIPYLSNPVAMNYTAEDFFAFYERVFYINQTAPGVESSTPYLFMVLIEEFFGNINQIAAIDDRLSRLYELLAVPMFSFNNVSYFPDEVIPNMGNSISLATVSYRVFSSYNGLIVS
jgi:hypothetical protein